MISVAIWLASALFLLFVGLPLALGLLAIACRVGWFILVWPWELCRDDDTMEEKHPVKCWLAMGFYGLFLYWLFFR